ncbi:uncharacterized protein LOC106466118 [Limulus polyphemus]|uniref:Uncharacterized protein LOC106466118 n=1 Tax=Limulus polyphemus TaxID=6850 RepID=A0ABM1T3A5_LIMPO|nr:uncharacterized protein LOC106466118 [Limulus polyphemus]
MTMITRLLLFMFVFSFGGSIPIKEKATILKTDVIHLSTGLVFRNSPAITFVEIYALGRNFTLNLRKSNIIHENFRITEIFGSEKEPSIEREVKVNLDDLKDNIYVDSSTRCVVYYKRNGNSIFMEGLLAENVIITPLTPEFNDYDQVNFPLSSGDSIIDYIEGIPHAVVLSAPKKYLIDDYVIPEVTKTDDLRENFTSNVLYSVDESVLKENFEFDEHSRNADKLQSIAAETNELNHIPEILHPEVLVIMDYAHWKGFEDVSVAALTRYITIFWNVSSKLQPYIEDHRTKLGFVDGKKVVKSINKYAVKWNSSREYDLGILMTGEDLSKEDGSKDYWGLAGVSFIGGACTQNMKIGVAEDEPGTYSGVEIVAHEIGHLLGVVHDGEDMLDFLGGPGASSCSASDGYLMAPVFGGYNDYKWSTCSIKQLRHFFSLGRSKCLRVDKLRNDTLLSAPEQNITPTDMCRELYPQNRENEVQAVILLDNHINSELVKKVLKNKSTKRDNILLSVLKEFKDWICELHATIVCKSLKQVPGDWKLANVTPLCKGEQEKVPPRPSE